MTRQSLFTLLLISAGACAYAQEMTVSSPDKKLCVTINNDKEGLTYSINYDGKEMMRPSMLGLKTDIGDFTKNMTVVSRNNSSIDETYTMRGTKASSSHYIANKIDISLSSPTSQRIMTLTMQVSNNDIAYRYGISGAKTTTEDEPRRVTILSEATSFMFPEATTTFLCPQIDGNHTGWMSTKPSYEEEYKADDAMNVKSRYGKGYTFPCLFRIGTDGWVLVSETGVGSNYCGSHLSDYSTSTGYSVAYPDATEYHGLGSVTPAMSLPGKTPWRTITVGSTLKPIVETTIPYDVVEQQYEATQDYKPGRYTWSWLVWQDNSINYEDQVKFIDTAAEMGFEYCLVDNWWDTQIGRDRIEQLSKYAQSKGVSLMLWYNSNGYANDAPQGPRNCMNTSIAREREMSWLKKIGVKGIKVDFFAGDKQETMQLYEDLLSDANRHGIQVVFHGCTLPRGWEKMYPNFVASEAVLASENVFFNEHHAKQEGFELTMHPFCRNAVASMDWGGSIMNHYLSKDNKSRHRRYTSDTFEMACAIVNQTSVQCIDMNPNNLTDVPEVAREFLKSVPTTWKETHFIDGYPGKFIVMNRKSTDGRTFIVGLNGENAARTLTINLPEYAGKELTYYYDAPTKKGELFPTPMKNTIKIDKKGNAKISMLGMGGIIITEN